MTQSWFCVGQGVWPAVVLLMSCYPGGVWADIRDTKHNLSGSSQAVADRVRAEREVCVFCHTPSADEVEAVKESVAPVWPQWQKSVEATFTFEMFDDIGRGSGAGPSSAVGSVSIACLSCHDGVQAFSVTPGSGSDHPFGVPYRGLSRGGEDAKAYRDRLLLSASSPMQMATSIGDDSEFKPARTAVVNKRQIWWAAVGVNVAQRSKNDLPLYPRRVSDRGGYEEVPFVECTSCHDPHTTRDVFLRSSTEGSKLCLTCHVK